MVEINLNISGTLADFEYASKVYCVTSKDEEYVLTLACSVLNSETGKKIYFKDIKMNLNFTRIDL